MTINWKRVLCAFSFHTWEPYLYPWLQRCTFCGSGRHVKT